jgi:cytochrome bd-type quinol oxidase subunit 2
VTTSRQIAAFLGPVAILLAVSEAKNLAIWSTGNPPLTYLAGLAWFLGGLAIVRVHNRWSRTWPVSITIVGWFFLVGGAFRLLFPDVQQGNQNTPALGAYAIDAMLVAFGSIMTLNAYHRPASHRRRGSAPVSSAAAAQASPGRGRA